MTQSDFADRALSMLDEIDRDIVNLLRIDGRMSFTEIGKRLEIPEATARYRVQKLLQSGIIQILAWPNPEKLGTPHILIVFLVVENDRVDSVAKALEEMPEIRFVAIAAGQYDIIIDIFFGSHDEVTSFFEKLKQIPGIIRHDSHFVLKLLKAEYKYTLT